MQSLFKSLRHRLLTFRIALLPILALPTEETADTTRFEKHATLANLFYFEDNPIATI